jgi:hypothetical protein
VHWGVQMVAMIQISWFGVKATRFQSWLDNGRVELILNKVLYFPIFSPSFMEMVLLDGSFGWFFLMVLFDGSFGWFFWMVLFDGSF